MPWRPLWLSLELVNHLSQRFPVQTEQKSWIHLWHYHSSNVKLLRDNIYTPFLLAYLHHSWTAWLILLLLLSWSVSFSSSSLRKGSWRESLSGSNGKFSTVTELLSSILKNEIHKASILIIVLRLFNRIFFKTDFIQLFKIFYTVL